LIDVPFDDLNQLNKTISVHILFNILPSTQVYI